MTPLMLNKGPLSGVRVIELGTMVAGPVAATLLADFGAEVIKVEKPQGGDLIREVGPRWEGEGLWWNVEGRNKKSITLDLRHPDGKDLLKQLVRHADVLIENFRPGTLSGWGIGYNQLSEENPALIMASVSGFGQTGPYAERPAYDRIGLAFSGYLNATGFSDRPPVRPGFAQADYQSAIVAAFGTMVALFHREARGGSGQHLDVTLFESMFRFTDLMTTAADKLGTKRNRQGNVHFAAAPGDHFETCDGRFIVLTNSGNDNLFAKLCEVMGKPEVAQDERFRTARARGEHILAINGIVAEWIKSDSVENILRALEAAKLPHQLILTIDDILKDPHYAARGSIATLNHPRLGPLKMPAPVPRMLGTPAPALSPAPLLGEHNDEIFGGLLGIDEPILTRLKRAGII